MHIFPLIQLTILHVSIMFPILSHYPYIVPLSINIYIDRIDIFHINPFPCTNWPDGLASHVRWASWSSPSARYDRPLPRRSCSPSWAPRTGFDGWDWDLNDEKWNINDDWWFNGDLVMLCWFYGMSLGFHLISWEFDGSWGDAGRNQHESTRLARRTCHILPGRLIPAGFGAACIPQRIAQQTLTTLTLFGKDKTTAG